MKTDDFSRITSVRQGFTLRKTKEGTIKKGPFWFGYWMEEGKLHRVYIGEELPQELQDSLATRVKPMGRTYFSWPGQKQIPQIIPLQFRLYCDHDARELGIEDDHGKWDPSKFREHIQDCPACQKFYIVLGKDLLDGLIAAYVANQA